MPVIREQKRVGAITPVGVVQPSREWSRQLAQLSTNIMGATQAWARVIDEEDTAEAIALAENAVITADENGVPQVDRSARESLSKSAQRAYDRTLDARYKQRLTLGLRTQIEAASQQFEGDPDGFRVAARAIVEGYGSTVPDDFRGHFSDDVEVLSAHYGARIGAEARAEYKRNAKSDFTVGTDLAIEKIRSAIAGGNSDGALQVVTEISEMGQGLLEAGIILPHELKAAQDAVYAQLGVSTIMQESKTWSPAEIDRVAADLVRDEGDYADYFPNASSRRAAANMLYQQSAQLEATAKANKMAADKQSTTLRVINGYAEGTANDKAALDEYLGTTNEDWANSPMVNDPVFWNAVNRAGFMPASMEGYLLRVSRYGASPEERMQGYQIWNALQSGVAPDGTPSLVGRDIPDNVNQRYQLTKALLEYGGYSLEAADLEAQARISKGWDVNYLVKQLAQYGSAPGDQDWDPQRVNAQVGVMVDNFLEEELGIAVDDRESAVAAQMVTYLVANSGGEWSTEQALDIVKNRFMLSHPESDYLYDPMYGPTTRGRHGPEVAYAMPGDNRPGFSAGGIIGAGNNALQILEDMARGESHDRRPWFDRMAEKAIKEMMPDRMLNDAGNYLIPGEDYRLEPIIDGSSQPAYRVYGRNQAGLWERLPGVLDLRDEYVQARQSDPVAQDQENERLGSERLASDTATYNRMTEGDKAAFEEYAKSKGYTGPDKMVLFREWRLNKEPGK